MVTRLYTQFERLPSSIIFNNFIADYSKQVKQRVSERFLFIHNLEEEITYTFSVRAQTIDYGPPVIGNVTTGPQSGSPGRPRDLVLSKTISAIKLSWTNSNSGRGPILGYYIESRRKGIIHFLCLKNWCWLQNSVLFLKHFKSGRAAQEEWQICEYSLVVYGFFLPNMICLQKTLLFDLSHLTG